MISVQGSSSIMDSVRAHTPNFMDKILIKVGVVDQTFVDSLVALGLTVVVNDTTWSSESEGRPYCELSLDQFSSDEEFDDEDCY